MHAPETYWLGVQVFWHCKASSQAPNQDVPRRETRLKDSYQIALDCVGRPSSVTLSCPVRPWRTKRGALHERIVSAFMFLLLRKIFSPSPGSPPKNTTDIGSCSAAYSQVTGISADFDYRHAFWVSCCNRSVAKWPVEPSWAAPNRALQCHHMLGQKWRWGVAREPILQLSHLCTDCIFGLEQPAKVKDKSQVIVVCACACACACACVYAYCVCEFPCMYVIYACM